MRKLFLTLALLVTLMVSAQQVNVQWSLSDPENLGATTITGDDAYSSLITTGFEQGSQIAGLRHLTASGAASGYESSPYDPPMASFKVTTRTSTATSGHNIAMEVMPVSGHTFKPTKVTFDACKVGTDGGGIDVYVSTPTGGEVAIEKGVTPLRNRVESGNPNGYSHHEFYVNDILVNDKFTLLLYVHNINGIDNENPKEIAFRNVVIEGAVDEKIFSADDFVKSISCSAEGKDIDLTSCIAGLKNGETGKYGTSVSENPTDFNVVCAAGFTAETDYDSNTATVIVKNANGDTVFTFSIKFVVRLTIVKPEPKPLNRGLMAVSLTGANMGTGNLVSWRHREADGYGVKYKLLRGTSADGSFSYLNRGAYILDKTNYADTNGNADSYYKLEVYNEYGTLIETEISGKTWDNQTFMIPVSAPTDPKNGALYNPNDASFCDMDGDGEYEIILKWSPSNEKDAASSGTTSNPFIDCYKLDGTLLWRIDLGPNFFTSAHTIQFIAWDFDGDGFGEFMCKTAPGTVDGQGNYVIMGNDDPTANLLGSRGKQVEGPEYITVFDGMTGAELSTIPYHTDYKAGEGYWGDSNQNRSERYLAALAYLDGYDKNPSPIFARGYYSGAFVAAYDWDGLELKERWVSRNITSGQGLWGEGAHWIAVGDCDGDGFQEIVYGSAALDHDGSLLYRTGLGHGDALHLGDFLTDRDGLEVFMVHEHKPYGYDLRDAKTGEILRRETASSDTGRGLAAHFDSTEPSAQFMYSASSAIFNLDDGQQIAESWAIGSSGAGINNRIYWDGDLYDEYYDKSIIAHWNPTNKSFDRYKVNNGWYTLGTLNNSTKYNPCVLGDILGDWREEIITHDGNSSTSATHLIINATSYTSDYRIPHLMDDPQYRVQVVNQNCCYNQPPHLSFDPAIVYEGNPNQANATDTSSILDIADDAQQEEVIYNLQGIRVPQITTPGIYIINGVKTFVK